MKLALSEISTPGASFAEDAEAYAAAGFDGIGIWEFKLPADDAASVRLLRERGLGVANCVPAIPSFLQLALPGMEGSADPGERVEALCASLAVHVCDTAGLAAEVALHASRVTGLHVADKLAPGAPGRVLPGEGVSHPELLVGLLRAAGFDEYIDIEVFSTPDAFWGLPVDEAAARPAAAGRSLMAQS